MKVENYNNNKNTHKILIVEYNFFIVILIMLIKKYIVKPNITHELIFLEDVISLVRIK